MLSISSTGTILTDGILRIGRILGISRHAFYPILPTIIGGIVNVCDGSANMDYNPPQLYQFTVIGGLYLEKQ